MSTLKTAFARYVYQFPKYIFESMHLHICDGGMYQYKINISMDEQFYKLWRCHVQSHPVIYPHFVLLGSDSSTVEIHISSELQDYEEVNADGESLENSVRH